MKEVGEETKLFMAGHSMGGGIALNYGIKGKHRERLSGIYVTGPLVKLHVSSGHCFAFTKPKDLLTTWKSLTPSQPALSLHSGR